MGKLRNEMSIKVSSFWQPKNHQILLYDKKTRCRDVVCKEGMLVQVGTQAALLAGTTFPAAFFSSMFLCWMCVAKSVVRVKCMYVSLSCVSTTSTPSLLYWYDHR